VISKENIIEFIIDCSTTQDYLDIDNDIVDKIATGIYQRIVSNDTTFFSLPMSETVMTHTIDDAPIRRAITMVINTSKLAMGGRSAMDFLQAKKDYFTGTYKLSADNPVALYNQFRNIDKYYEDEIFGKLTETGLLDTLYKNTTLLEKMNESLMARGILSDEKDATYFETIKNKLPNLYLLWISYFFSDNQEYLTDSLILKMIEKVNKRGLDLSYYYNIFSNLDERIEDDIDELTDEEVELLI